MSDAIPRTPEAWRALQERDPAAWSRAVEADERLKARERGEPDDDDVRSAIASKRQPELAADPVVARAAALRVALSEVEDVAERAAIACARRETEPLRSELGLALEQVATARRELAAGIAHQQVVLDGIAASLRHEMTLLGAALRAELGGKR